jgi:DNA polymerase-1
MSDKKCLYLLDAYALISRLFRFIKKPRINSKGMDTSAIMGFMNALMDVIKRKPDHLAVAFDRSARTEMYQEYKAHRDETPGNSRIAIPYIKIYCEMHIPIIEIAG